MRDIDDKAKEGLPDGKYRIGDAVLDSFRHELLVGGEVKALEPRLVRLLLTLVTAKGEPVGREALLGAVSALPFAGDEALTQAISKLRQALGDTPKSPTYIRTIPRRGYALIAPVEWVEEGIAPATRAPAKKQPNVSRSDGRPVILMLALAVLLLAGLVVWAQLFPKEVVRETELILEPEQEFNTKSDWEFIEKKDMPEEEPVDDGQSQDGTQ